MEPAVAAQRRILGDTHNETLCSMETLAGNLAEMGDRTNAEALLQEVIAGFRQTLGSEHPDTLFAVANLGQTRRMMGLHEEGTGMIREVYDGLCRVHGPAHEKTILVEEMLRSSPLPTSIQRLAIMEKAMLDRNHTPDDTFIRLCRNNSVPLGDGATEGERDPATARLLCTKMMKAVEDEANHRRALQQELVSASAIGLQGRPELNGSRGPGHPGVVKHPTCFPMKIHFVWGFCMGAQGALPPKMAVSGPGSCGRQVPGREGPLPVQRVRFTA